MVVVVVVWDSIFVVVVLECEVCDVEGAMGREIVRASDWGVCELVRAN